MMYTDQQTCYCIYWTNKVGLSDFLRGDIPLADIVKTTKIQNLSFVSAGSIQSNSSELLNNGVMRDFVAQAKEHFDYIIFDNAPIGVVYDPVIIGMYSDFNLILVRLNHSKIGELDAINKIGHEGILKNVMVAVNGKKQVKGYGYYTDDSKAGASVKGVFGKAANLISQEKEAPVETAVQGSVT